MKRKQFLQTLGIGVAASPFASISKSEKSEAIKKLDPKVIRAEDGKVTNVIGDIQTLKLSGKDTAGQVVMIEESNKPGTKIPMHVHTKEDEIFKVLQGQLKVTVGDQTTILKAGDIAFAPKEIPHSWEVIGDEECKTILTAFPAGIELMFDELGQLPAGPPDFPKVAEICGRYGIRFI